MVASFVVIMSSSALGSAALSRSMVGIAHSISGNGAICWISIRCVGDIYISLSLNPAFSMTFLIVGVSWFGNILSVSRDKGSFAD